MRLDLSHNEIDSMERTSLFYLNDLENVDLSHNKLDESNFWKGTFFYLSGVRTINLSFNSFTDVQNLSPMLFRSAAQLEELHFTDNAITRIPNGIFDTLTGLKTLELQRNAIDFIAEKASEITIAAIQRSTINMCSMTLITLILRVGSSVLCLQDLSQQQHQPTYQTFPFSFYLLLTFSPRAVNISSPIIYSKKGLDAAGPAGSD